MIWESSYWKDDLLRRASVLERRRSQKRWPDASLARVEQDMMLAFYSIRKLIEASKLSDAIAGQTVTLTMHPPTGRPVTKMNWHKLDELFDLEVRSEEQRNLLFVCHQFVHSYIFTVVFGSEGGLEGFFFASDRQRTHGLYYLALSEVIRFLQEIGNDYPNVGVFRRDPASQDYVVQSFSYKESHQFPEAEEGA